jgi:DNA-binding transcriptional LysR family regulator
MTVKLNRDDLDLSLLRTFLAVIRYGSMGKTAAAVDMTQPAVSQQMLRLEKIVGRPLFSRTREGVEPTHYGELLVRYASRSLELNEEALACIREESASGRVRLGISNNIALAGLTHALKRFQRTHPAVELEIVMNAPAKLNFLLAQGALDLVVSDPPQIGGTSIGEWGAHLAWFASRELCLERFRVLPLVLCESAFWRQAILGSLRATGWEWRVVFESACPDTTLTAVESGLGVSALLRGTIKRTDVGEIKNARLPLLPQARFGMFRGNAAPSRAQALMETALATFLKALSATTIGDSAEKGPSLSDADSRFQLTSRSANVSTGRRRPCRIART